MLKNWLKIYWYNTMKHKMYFLLTVVGLAIGIASVVLASLYYLEEASYDQWNPNKNEVYVVENVGESMQYSAQPLPLGRYIKDNSDVVEDYLYYSYYQSADITYQDRIFKIEKIFDVQNNFFSFFPYDFIYGNAKTALVNENDVVIDLSVSNKIFGKEINPIGKQVEFNDRIYLVSGVFDLNDKRSSLMPLVVTNRLTKEVLINSDWGSASYSMLVKTKDTKRVGEIITKVIDDNYYAAVAKDQGISLEEMKATTLKELITRPEFHILNGVKMQSGKAFFGEPSTNMRLLTIVVFLSISILLLSIFNYVNLSLTQMMERGKEVGIRKVLGAKRKEIYKQNILESFIIVLFSFVIGICCLEIILPYINVFFHTNIEVSFIKHISVLVAILIIIVVLCGIIPASYISNYNVVYVLKGKISRGIKGKYLRNVLLILQFVIACFFIICSLIINKQVNHMLDKDLGFKGGQVMTVPFLQSTKYDSIRFDKYQNFKIEISKVKGVEDIATSSLGFGLYGGRTVFSFFEYGGKKSLTQRVNQDYSFMDAMQIQLKEGRMLSEKFATDSISNVLVNESFVKQFEIKNPINTEIVSNKLKFTVVGVIHDFHVVGVENKISPQVYGYFTTFKSFKGQFDRVYIKLAEGEDIESIVKNVERIWRKYNIGSKAPFSNEFVDKEFAETYDKMLAERKAFSILNYVVVFIALFGLFAVSSFTIGTKLREVAIRKVLGAETSGLLRQLSFQYIIYCIIGFRIAVFPSYYFLNKWLENYAYRIEIDWSVYVYSLLLILGLTLLIVISRAYKATRVDVLKYIKYE